MNDLQKKTLTSCGTDVDGAVYRFGGSEDIYVSCLKAFLEDDCMSQFSRAFAAMDWETATAAVHTLKGASGNMGFVPLMRAAQDTLSLLRAGQYKDAEAAARLLESEYLNVTEGIRQSGLLHI